MLLHNTALLATNLYRAARSCRSIGLHCIYSLRTFASSPGTPRGRRTGHQQQRWLGGESAGGMSADRTTAGASIAYGPWTGQLAAAIGAVLRCKSRPKPKLHVCLSVRYYCPFKYSRLYN